MATAPKKTTTPKKAPAKPAAAELTPEEAMAQAAQEAAAKFKDPDKRPTPNQMADKPKTKSRDVNMTEISGGTTQAKGTTRYRSREPEATAFDLVIDEKVIRGCPDEQPGFYVWDVPNKLVAMADKHGHVRRQRILKVK